MRDQNTTDKLIQSMRSAWTIIELIFIIVIIGILVAIALPRLAAVRDDASLVKDISNMSLCIQNSAAQYTATSTIEISEACNRIVCYNITDTDPENFTVVTVPNAASFCSRIDTIGGHLAKTYSFKGSRIRL